jgi:hypothetical protein
MKLLQKQLMNHVAPCVMATLVVWLFNVLAVKNGVILNVSNYHPTNYTSLTIPVETLPVKCVFLSQTLF